MMRLPESRIRSADALKNAARPFVDHSIEGLRTSAALDVDVSRIIEVIYPSIVSRDRAITSVTQVPHTRPKKLQEWLQREGDCLHCSQPLHSCVPAVKHKVDNRYWIYGQFCSPSCSLGYLREHEAGPQAECWTREMLKQCFNLESSSVCPPRFMLKRFGGTLDLPSWKSMEFIACKEPPLATFAMYAESLRAKPAEHSILHNLQRPTSRDTMPTKSLPTGREPVLLEALASEMSPSPKRDRKEKKKKLTLNTFLMEEE